MSLEDRIRTYYQALIDEEPLEEYFVTDPKPVKFGITESLHGYHEIAEGLREQTRTTSDWDVESHRLQAEEAGDVGWFSDHVTMQWTDEERDERIEWETRWSGTMLRMDEDWLFVRMHVSAVPER